MRKFLFILVFTLLALLAWSPWQTKESAENKVIKAFESGQVGITDGCGFNCEGCGVESSQKIPFGYLVNIKYKCGLKNYFQGERRFVTPIGTSLTIKKYGINYPCNEVSIYSEKDCECVADPHGCKGLEKEACEENLNCYSFGRSGTCDCPICEIWLEHQCLPKEN